MLSVAVDAKNKFESAHLNFVLRVAAHLLFLKSGCLVVVFHLRTKLDKKGQLGKVTQGASSK